MVSVCFCPLWYADLMIRLFVSRRSAVVPDSLAHSTQIFVCVDILYLALAPFNVLGHERRKATHGLGVVFIWDMGNK